MYDHFLNSVRRWKESAATGDCTDFCKVKPLVGSMTLLFALINVRTRTFGGAEHDVRCCIQVSLVDATELELTPGSPFRSPARVSSRYWSYGLQGISS